MSGLAKLYNFEDQQVRTLVEGDGIWFNATDVCRVLGYVRERDAVRQHVDPEDAVKRRTPTKGGEQSMTYVNESGLYALIFGSTLPDAKRFKRWVTSEVLPSIRQTGQYVAPHDLSTLNLFETLVGVLKEQDNRTRAFEARQADSNLTSEQVSILDTEMKIRYDKWVSAGISRGVAGTQISRIKRAIKEQCFERGLRSTRTYKEIPQKHFTQVVSLIRTFPEPFHLDN